MHIRVKIGEIGIFRYGFVEGLPAESLAQLLDQCGFTNTDISSDGYKFLHLLSATTGRPASRPAKA
jgi:hypothetical protein